MLVDEEPHELGNGERGVRVVQLRDEFVRENGAALDATIAAWKARLDPELMKPVDVWYDDSVAALRAMEAGAG